MFKIKKNLSMNSQNSGKFWCIVFMKPAFNEFVHPTPFWSSMPKNIKKALPNLYPVSSLKSCSQHLAKSCTKCFPPQSQHFPICTFIFRQELYLKSRKILCLPQIWADAPSLLILVQEVKHLSFSVPVRPSWNYERGSFKCRIKLYLV